MFKPMGGGEILEKDIPILVDGENTVLRIYPHRDSIETYATDSTRKIITTAAGVPGVERELLVKTVEIVVNYSGKSSVIYKY